jgi:drug/metabolite transporter (DMT)-like permease
MLTAALALAVAAAGWYYLFFSRAAGNLQGIEDEAANRRRIRLRRINGLLMLLLGAALFAMFSLLRREDSGGGLALSFLAVTALLLAVLALALVDLRLTVKMQHKRKRRTR